MEEFFLNNCCSSDLCLPDRYVSAYSVYTVAQIKSTQILLPSKVLLVQRHLSLSLFSFLSWKSCFCHVMSWTSLLCASLLPLSSAYDVVWCVCAQVLAVGLLNSSVRGALGCPMMDTTGSSWLQRPQCRAWLGPAAKMAMPCGKCF